MYRSRTFFLTIIWILPLVGTPCVLDETAVAMERLPNENAPLGFPWNSESVLFPACPMPSEEKYLCVDVDEMPTGLGEVTKADVRGQSRSDNGIEPWECSWREVIPGLGRPLPRQHNESWRWQWLPQGILYRAYFASNKESRLAVHFVHEAKEKMDYWDPTLGGRIPLLRFGNSSPLYPEGLQLDVEAAAIARLTLDHERELWGTDYRFGAPWTLRKGKWEAKLGYYHISSHLGDEKLVRDYLDQGVVYRRNYVRDCLMLGIAFRPDANWRFYGGMDYAFYTADGAEPWQFELGAEYSPILLPTFQGSPFWACHLRWSEENCYHTYVAMEAGWQWKTLYQQTFRTGLYFMSGPADQYQYYDRHEKQIGFGFWYDY